jgi:hypothetical protein
MKISITFRNSTTVPAHHFNSHRYNTYGQKGILSKLRKQSTNVFSCLHHQTAGQNHIKITVFWDVVWQMGTNVFKATAASINPDDGGPRFL